MSLSLLKILYFVPDFVEIQRKSFLNLLDEGLIKELSKRNPITNIKHNLELFFYPEYYKLNPPDWTPKEAILNSKTYACRLYVPIHLSNKENNQIKVQWSLLGNLPLMTKRGHFILNGSPRVIINQMVRSPGIYYQEVIHKNEKRTYYADLISHRGAWLRLETDKKRRIWVRMKKTPKVSILVFLQALGFSKEKIFQSINYTEFLEFSFLKDEHPKSSKQALQSFYVETHKKKEKSEITIDLAKKFIFRKFFNSRTYDLSEIGRIQLNKKLGLSVPLTILTLTENDILFATEYLIKLKYGLGAIDDIDDLKNRRVRASGELIQNQLGTGFIRLEKIIREKLKKPQKKLKLHHLITTKPVNGALREFFGSSPLSQFLDQTNPLAELTHKRRLSSLGPGGISRETAGMAVRGIHPSHYGRICPIETPEGPNAGLVNSLTSYAKINSEGFIETPFYNVYNGQLQKINGPTYFSAAKEERIQIAPGDLKSSALNFLPQSIIPVRSIKEFKKVTEKEVDYISISPIQMISIATSLIPFLEHDDANRALMGSNMQRQAVPLISPERPIVGTGLESRVTADSGHVIQSKTSGFVSYVSGKKIVLKNPLMQRKAAYSQFYKIDNSFLSKNKKRINKFLKKKQKLNTHLPLNNCTSEEIKIKDSKFRKTISDFAKTEFIEKSVAKKISSNNSFAVQGMRENFTKPLSFVNYPLNSLVANSSKNKHSIFLNNTKQKKFSQFLKLDVSQLVTEKKKKLKKEFDLKTSLRAFKKKVGINVNHRKTQLNKISILNTFFYSENFLLTTLQMKIILPKKSIKIISSSNFDKQSSSWGPSTTHYTYFKNEFNNIYLKKNKAQKNRCKRMIREHTIALEKQTFKNKYYIRGGRLFLENRRILGSVVEASFLLKQNILKVAFTNKFNWYNFIFLGLRKNYNNKTIKNFNSPVQIKNWKINFSMQLVGLTTNLRNQNNYFQILKFKTLSPYNFSFFEHYSELTYFTKLKCLTYSIENLNILYLPNICNGSPKSLISEKIKNKISQFCIDLDTINILDRIKKHQYTESSYPQYKNNSYNSFYIKKKSNLRLRALKLYKTQIADRTNNLDFRFIEPKALNFKLRFSTNLFFNIHAKFTFLSNHKILKASSVKYARNIYLPFLISSDRLHTPILPNLLTESQNLSTKAKNTSFLVKEFNIKKNFCLESINYFLDQYQRSNQNTCVTQWPIVKEGEWIQKGDLLADGAASVKGELALGKTILVAYMPWEGYNFEDAILISERLIYEDIYTSIHIERYDIEIRDTKFGVEQITNQIGEIETSQLVHLDSRGIAKIGSWVKEGDILVGKLTPIKKKSLSSHEKLLYDVVQKEIPITHDTSLRVPKNVYGKVVNIQILKTDNIPPGINFQGPGRVYIYIAEKRKIQVGDKMAGRHGNKGIISKVLPRQDMPYLPNGVPVDMVLNPLGVPSRMNVGQIFECLLGLAGKHLNQQFKIVPFDEIYGPEASRSLVYSKLLEARIKTGQKWLFTPDFAGKTKLFDGRSGECFDQAITVGEAYMLKLVHLVDEKIHARSTGPYSFVTQQPLRGRSKHGGQRLGEMEVWALEGFGAAYTLQELLTVKSDDIKGRHQVMDAILNSKPISLGTPESFKVLIRELQSLCLDVGVYTIEVYGRRKRIDAMTLS